MSEITTPERFELRTFNRQGLVAVSKHTYELRDARRMADAFNFNQMMTGQKGRVFQAVRPASK